VDAPKNSARLQTVLELLAQEGVTSLEDLAAHVAAEAVRTGSSEEEVLYGRPTIASVGTALPWRTERLEGPYRHAPTELPVLLDDDRELAPGELSQLDGVALDYVWDDAAAERQVMRAFSVARDAYEYLRAQPVRTSPAEGHPVQAQDHTASFHVGGTPAGFFEHVNFSGASGTLDLAHVLPDLTQNHMSGILWWWTSWNDQISSVAAGSGWVTLWEHVYPPQFGYPPGSKLHVAPFQTMASLVPSGWNDRVSAINHHFFAE
jgi:hypothetical protein